MSRPLVASMVLLTSAVACDADVVDVDAGTPRADAGVVDAGFSDAGTDAGFVDGGTDAGFVDGGTDAGFVDAGFEDAGFVDAGFEDAGFVDAGFEDAGFVDAGFVDAGFEDAGFVDPPCPTPLLVPGLDISKQGWTVVSQTPFAIESGANDVRLSTSTTAGARTSGQLLITRPDAFDATQPFAVEIVMQVEQVNTHNSLDSGAAILGSFTPPFGNSTDRSQMIYLDTAAVGWADDTQSAARAVLDGAFHVYRLEVDAARVATFSVDGVVALTRNNFTSTGTIAIGDQTNDPNVDGTIRLRSVTVDCQ